jgi:hypothetical protein
MDKQKCPKCGEDMLFMYGCGWDYDRWVCMNKNGESRFCFCNGEIELESTTYPEGFEQETN